MSDSLPLPTSLDWMRADSTAAAWLARLPEIVAAASERWDLRVSAPFDGGAVSWVAPATSAEGLETVLKISYPHRESEHEGAALRLWDGDGAVRLLDDDAQLGALLLERCRPGHHLSTVPASEALEVLTDLVARTARPAGRPFTPVSIEAAGWRESLDRHLSEWATAVDHRIIEVAKAFLDDLVGGAADGGLLVHQDLHGDNVLAATREPWLVIDPKPLLADRAFALAPIIRSRELGHSRTDVLGRLDRLSAELAVDRNAAARHAIAQTVAWGFGPTGPIEHHFEAARWLLDVA